MKPKKPRRLDLTGQKFGEWTVLEKGDIGQNGAIYWKCRCSCGTELSVQAGGLRNGHSESCGHDRTIHGYSLTPTGAAWYGLKQRCNNPKDKNYMSYGGRGIKVCERWLERFENFLEDMGPSPGKGMSIDRIDVHGNYEPNNCRWATRSEQQRNRRNNPRAEYEGKLVTLVELSERFKISYRALKYRLDNGWEINEALKTPSQLE